MKCHRAEILESELQERFWYLCPFSVSAVAIFRYLPVAALTLYYSWWYQLCGGILYFHCVDLSMASMSRFNLKTQRLVACKLIFQHLQPWSCGEQIDVPECIMLMGMCCIGEVKMKVNFFTKRFWIGIRSVLWWWTIKLLSKRGFWVIFLLMIQNRKYACIAMGH